MQLNRKGSTIGLPPWLLALCCTLVIARVVLQNSHGAGRQSYSVDWHDPVQGIVSAKSQAKPVLLLFVGADTARTHQIEETVLSNRSVSSSMSSFFYAIRVVGKTTRNMPAVNELFHKYSVMQLPTLIITTPAGTPVARLTGNKSASPVYQFIMTTLLGDHLQEVLTLDRGGANKTQPSSNVMPGSKATEPPNKGTDEPVLDKSND